MTKRDYLGNFELMVLLVLIRLDDNAYGVPISEELEKRTARQIAIGSVYAALERLEDKGFRDFGTGRIDSRAWRTSKAIFPHHRKRPERNARNSTDTSQPPHADLRNATNT
jgi:DNA-binding PadR family transcriptional regulator